MSDSSDLTDGIDLYRDGLYNEALAFFLQYNAEDAGEEMEITYYTGLIYSRLERYEDAMFCLEQVVTAGTMPDVRIMQCRLLLAVIYTMTGRASLAAFEIDRLTESGYKPAEVQSVYAYLLWKQRRVDECIGAYEKALEYDRTNATAMNGLGFVLACSGKDFTRALTLCKRALDESPDSAAYMDSLGWVYFNLGLLTEAENYILRARNTAPDNREIAEHYRIIAEKKRAASEFQRF